ncbi:MULTISPECIES: hypothetical protein [Rhodomicrobium]|uniref:hypothetical protein n=1 Tax=Rhodomicrobium TaxID=1068 RepID=UPI00148320EA|nr:MULTISPECIES: hypothetical protein [Rhodomicrobium]
MTTFIRSLLVAVALMGSVSVASAAPYRSYGHQHYNGADAIDRFDQLTHTPRG